MSCIWNLPVKDRHCNYCGIQFCDGRYVDTDVVIGTSDKITEIITGQIKEKLNDTEGSTKECKPVL